MDSWIYLFGEGSFILCLFALVVTIVNLLHFFKLLNFSVSLMTESKKLWIVTLLILLLITVNYFYAHNSDTIKEIMDDKCTQIWVLNKTLNFFWTLILTNAFIVIINKVLLNDGDHIVISIIAGVFLFLAGISLIHSPQFTFDNLFGTHSVCAIFQ